MNITATTLSVPRTIRFLTLTTTTISLQRRIMISSCRRILGIATTTTVTNYTQRFGCCCGTSTSTIRAALVAIQPLQYRTKSTVTSTTTTDDEILNDSTTTTTNSTSSNNDDVKVLISSDTVKWKIGRGTRLNSSHVD